MKHSTASAAAIRARLTAQLADPIPMRRGSLTERTVKCSRPGCPCKDRPEARHGPYFSLTRSVAGTTQTRLIAEEQADTVRRQIETGRQFRDATELYWEACERLADAEIERLVDPAAARREKGGSVRRSRRRLRKKSPRS
jgi:hypothetical protein